MDKMQLRLDDDFTTLTTDVARVWFRLGEEKENTASIGVIVRSVGHNNQAQIGMHEMLCREIRKAVEEIVARPMVSISMPAEAAREKGGDAHGVGLSNVWQSPDNCDVLRDIKLRIEADLAALGLNEMPAEAAREKGGER